MESNTNNGEEMNTLDKMTTETITCKFTRDEDSDRVITRRVSITLSDSAPITDFSDAAWNAIYKDHPDAVFVDEL